MFRERSENVQMSFPLLDTRAKPPGRRLSSAGIGLALCFAAACSADVASADFPQSSLVSSVSWDYGSMKAAAAGSDLWALAWASDGNQYTIWGDGGGFGGNDTNGRTQWGVARIEGSAEAWRGVNVFGGVSPEAPGWPMQDTTGTGIGYKVDSMTAIDDSLVAIINNWAAYPSYTSKIIKSDDFGRSWKNSDGTPVNGASWDWPANTAGVGFRPLSFIDLGKGYSLSTDGYVYFYRESQGNKLFLGRTPKTSYMDKNSYTYRRSDGTWIASIENADAVLQNDSVSGVNAIYHPYLKRYILTFNCTPGASSEADMHDWMMLEGPSPWGPWYKIGEWHNWIDSTYKFQYRISPKWIADSSTFYLIFSGGSPQSTNTYDWDAFHVIKGTFQSAPVTDGTTPKPPSGLSIH